MRNGLLALLSVAIGLVVCEAALRVFHPRYEYASASQGDSLAQREPVAGTYRRHHDPDTLALHRVIHNNLGARQSRDFPPAVLDETVNIAFFGDSQTLNVAMPAQYSYSEPLDFLLNAAAQASARGGANEASSPAARFSVLSFGTAAWGPARSYLRWRHLPVRGKLAHVFYTVNGNDLDELRLALEGGMVRRGESGEMLPGRPAPTPAWQRVVARTHLSWLAVDAWRRLAARWPETGLERARSDGVELGLVEALGIFRDVLWRWKTEVEADGGVFHIVVLPNPPGGWDRPTDGHLWIPPLRERLGFGVFDLAACFAAAVPGFDYRDFRFANDRHWNPAANMVAATCLYRHLEDALGLPKRTDDDLARMRHAYYRAFMDSPAWEGTRYMPDAAWARPAANAAAGAPQGGKIVAKYLALEVAPPKERRWLDAVRAARAAGPLATSAWDVYANLPARLLVYVKNACPEDEGWRPAGQFFLHAVPFTPEKLDAAGARLGRANLDSGSFSPLRRLAGGECVFSVPLPDYPLAAARTGRYTKTGEGAQSTYANLWSAEFAVPLARSVWDVHASASGRGLDYVKAPCAPVDTAARFFLHVHPLRAADLPAGAGGYANLDFAGERAERGEDGACRVSAALPEFPIDFVRTGQFRPGVVWRKRLWSARIDFAEVERLPTLVRDGV